jgi:DNA topoisomerase III
LSYPRTETNCFNPTINLRNIVNELVKSREFGDYANRVASGEMWGGPKNGKQDDKAHPPIHPVKHAAKEDMSFDEWRVYELVCRHFLACVSKDAVGSETKVDVNLGGEQFTAKGLIIEEQNWLEVFHYDKWSDSVLPPIQKGEEFNPTLNMTDGETKAPSPLTEADLIQKMD